MRRDSLAAQVGGGSQASPSASSPKTPTTPVAAIIRKLSDRVMSSPTAALIRHVSSRFSDRDGSKTPPGASSGSHATSSTPQAIITGPNAGSYTPPAMSSIMTNKEQAPQLEKLEPVWSRVDECIEGVQCCFLGIALTVATLAMVASPWVLLAGVILHFVTETADRENMKAAGNATEVAQDGSGSGSGMKYPMVMIIVSAITLGMTIISMCTGTFPPDHAASRHQPRVLCYLCASHLACIAQFQ